MFELRPYHRGGSHPAYNPFRDMEEMERRFFDRPFASFFGSGDIAEFKTDISDRGDSYLLEADLTRRTITSVWNAPTANTAASLTCRTLRAKKSRQSTKTGC